MLITSLYYIQGTEALSEPSTGQGNSQGQEMYSFEETYVELPFRRVFNSTAVESKAAIELLHNCQTNAKYTIRQITNAKYQKSYKCQTSDPLSECQLKYTKKAVNPNTKEQIIIKRNPTLLEQFLNAFIEEEQEYQNEILVHMSSNCQYRNADENMNVRKSRGTINVSHSHFRLRREREPSRIPYRMVTRLLEKKNQKFSEIIR